MHLNKLVLALSLAALALPMSVMAQDAAPADAPAAEAPASNLSWNFSLTSDYVFRGITQTDFKPAAQGGLDYSFGDSGWAIGAWGSNVDFGTGSPDIEVDTYIGWSHALSDKWNFNILLDRYNYLGESQSFGNIDFNELIGKVTYNDMITFTAAYSDNWAQGGYSETYFNVSGHWSVGNDCKINAGVGRSNFSDNVGSYTDWNLGISHQFGPVNAALNYYDTNGDFVDSLYGNHKASDSIVLSFAFGG